VSPSLTHTRKLSPICPTGVQHEESPHDVGPNDVLMGIGGVTLVAGEPGRRDLADRLLDLLIDGLTSGAPNA
jgi:hypothetical protein